MCELIVLISLIKAWRLSLHCATPEQIDIIQEHSDREDTFSMLASHLDNFWINFSGQEEVAIVWGTFSSHSCPNKLEEKLVVELEEVIS